MNRVFNLKGTIFNVDNEEEVEKLIDQGAEEIDSGIFRGLSHWASNDNTRLVDGQWTFFENPEELEGLMHLKIETLKNSANNFIIKATQSSYPEFEKQTFERQREEALAWQKDSATPTPLIDILAASREIDRELLLQKILNKVQQFERLSFAVAGQRQRYEDQIKSLTSILELEALEFNFTLPQ